MAFTRIPLSDIATHLEAAGFTRRVNATKAGAEVVYEIANKRDRRFVVVVYTSCDINGVTRGCGKDAIRVVLVADAERGRIGVAKATRINRTGPIAAILDRITDRARDMYRLSNQIIKAPRCKCGAPTYPTSGKCILTWRCTAKEWPKRGVQSC